MYMLLLENKEAGGTLERLEKEIIKFQAFLVILFSTCYLIGVMATEES